MAYYDPTVDPDRFPEPGTDHVFLIWLAQRGIIDEGDRESVVTLLEGPGEWFRVIQDLHPEYVALRDTLPDGAYLARFRIEYDAEPYEPIEHLVLVMLDARRVATPSREELRSEGAVFVQAVRA